MIESGLAEGGSGVKRAGPAVYGTVAEAVDGLTSRGFVEHFRIADGYLQGLETGETFRASDVIIREYHRFEGVSDPDDMAIVYAVETTDGVRGTLTDAFGVYADPGMSEALDGASLCL
ncbi:MAG TPA: hypothetical protein VML54_07680 [Candidatus Limnocylindrales bacterium]|nr:hypothetical protein [Candidatus Limnocylindrales bacterium]